MKKLLSLLSVLILSVSMANAGEVCNKNCPPPPPAKMEKKMPPKFNLEKELKLTDEQITKARQQRMESVRQIKPLFDELKVKQEQKRKILKNQTNKDAQAEELTAINKDITVIKQKIRAIKIQNDKDFEALLTDKQKKKFEKIKSEARKDFVKRHKRHHRPCQRPCPQQ